MTSESFANWMMDCKIIRELEFVTHQPIRMCYSRQSEIDTKNRRGVNAGSNDGYPIYRFRAVVVNPNGEWERQFCKPKFIYGDAGYVESSSYHNEWKYLESVNLETHDYWKMVGI